MKEDPIWQAFRETGDPLYYLLYKAAERAIENRTAQTTGGSRG